MATAEDRTKALQTATELLANLAAVDPSTLARTSDLSPDINFKDAVPHFQAMLEVCKQLSQRDLSRLAHPQLSGINSACNTLANLIKRVEEFTLNQNTPGDVCRDLITAVGNAYDDVMNPLTLPLAFTATQATDYARIEREAKGYHATMKTEAEKLSAFIENARAEADRALAAVKEQAAEAGVSTNAQIFVKDADVHEQSSKTWLLWTVVVASVTFLAALAAVYVAVNYHPDDVGAAIQYVVAKLLVFSSLTFGAVWCAKNYRAQKHNATLNRHRANALMTFRAFVEGTADERVRDAILLQASQAAFSGRPTGFDVAERDSPTVNPVVEILGKTLPRSGSGD